MIETKWVDDRELKGPKPKFTQIDLIGEEIGTYKKEALDIYKSMVAFKNNTGRSISKIEVISTEEGKEEVRFFSKRIFLTLNIVTNQESQYYHA